jgi:hypothetical protein
MYRYRLNLRVLMLFEELEKEEGGEGRDCNENRSFVHDKSSSYFPFQGVVGLFRLTIGLSCTVHRKPAPALQLSSAETHTDILMFFCNFLLGYRVRWTLLCLTVCLPYMIIGRCLVLNPECCRSIWVQATNLSPVP